MIQIPDTEQQLLENARQIAGLSLAQLAGQLDQALPVDLKTDKGRVGQLLELALGATASSLPEPDFQKIGVELKTLPLNARGQPAETTYVCTVPLTNTGGQSWQTCWVRRKLQRVLWVPIEADARIALAKRRIGMPLLWSPSAEQEAVLRQDWEEHMELIVTGQIETISARQGTWLQIRPKAAHGRVLCNSVDAEGKPAETLPRGFYLRTEFTRAILATHYATAG